MTRHVFALDLRDDPAAIEAYRAHHQRVWPEVIVSLRRVGILDMDIYILGRRLVMVVDTDGRDVRRAFAAHVASGPRVAEWEAMMQALQQAPPGGRPGEWWAEMEPVFSLRAQEDASAAAAGPRS